MILPKPSGWSWNNNPITDHNRSEIAIRKEVFENKRRMINGTLRKYHIASKKIISTSWDDLPHSSQFTIDNAWGYNEMVAFHEVNLGAFELTLNYGEGEPETILVMFSEFDGSVKKRGLYTTHALSVSLEEV